MENLEKKILEEIKRFNNIINYNFLLNEGIIGKLAAETVETAIKTGILTTIKNTTKETLETIIKSSKNHLGQVIDLDKFYKTALPSIEKALLDAGLDNIDDLTRMAIRNNYNTIVRSQGDDLLKSAKQLFGSAGDNAIIMTKTASQYVESLVKKIPSKVKTSVDDVLKNSNVAAEAGEIATRNPRLKIGLRNAANAVNAGTPPPTNQVLPQLADAGLTQTTKKGIEITTKNLKKAAFLIGGGTLALALIGYLLDNGVTVQDDSANVETDTETSGNWATRMFGIDQETGGEGGGSYSGGERKWRSMGRSYDSQILTALGKTGSDTLTDDDIKDIYNRLKSAGKIKE